MQKLLCGWRPYFGPNYFRSHRIDIGQPGSPCVSEITTLQVRQQPKGRLRGPSNRRPCKRPQRSWSVHHDALPIQQSLGTYWCIESDTLGFRIELKDKPLSLRDIFSTISSVYDPLGTVSPVILTGKQILQDLCRQKVDWDDPLPDEIIARWERWRTELPLLEKVKLNRCVKPPGFGSPVQAEVHSFSDASESGIGQVSYLRTVDSKREVHVSFLIAKSRVAPIKPISIPLMELTAAVVSVNVTKMLQSELTYYTDSEVVIG